MFAFLNHVFELKKSHQVTFIYS